MHSLQLSAGFVQPGLLQGPYEEESITAARFQESYWFYVLSHQNTASGTMTQALATGREPW